MLFVVTYNITDLSNNSLISVMCYCQLKTIECSGVAIGPTANYCASILLVPAFVLHVNYDMLVYI